MKDTAAVVLQQIGGLGGDNKRVLTTVSVGRDNGVSSSDGKSRGSTPAMTTLRTTKNQSKMLLRELCVDKDYLEQLTSDPSNNITDLMLCYLPLTDVRHTYKKS